MWGSRVRIPSSPPRRSKLHIACSDFLCLWQKSQSALIPLLLLSQTATTCVGLQFGDTGGTLDVISFAATFSLLEQTSLLTHSAAAPLKPGPVDAGLRVCFLWFSLCDRAFYFIGNRKHHLLRSLAPPFPNRTRAMHWASIWFLRGLTANRIIFGRKAQRSALWAGLCISAYDTWDSNPRALGNVPGARFNPRRPAPQGRSNPFESTTSEQAAYRLLRLFMPLAKKSECAHSAAPP